MLCSAQTSAVTGAVASLPSLCAATLLRRVDPEMRVHVDQAGRDPQSRGVYNGRIRMAVACAHPYLAASEVNIGVVEALPSAIQHGCVGQ